MQPKLFKNWGFSAGLITMGIASLGQFGMFFIMPIFLQNVLDKTALQTGLIFLPTSIAILIFGPLSGFVASKLRPRWVVSVGMFALVAGLFWFSRVITTDVSIATMAFPLALIGLGIGASTAQLTNVIISAAPPEAAGEASAANNVMRQLGTSIGIAVLGVVLASSLTTNIRKNVQADAAIPAQVKTVVMANTTTASVQRSSGQTASAPPQIQAAIKHDVDQSLTQAARTALTLAAGFILLGAASSLYIPAVAHEPEPAKAAH